MRQIVDGKIASDAIAEVPIRTTNRAGISNETPRRGDGSRDHRRGTQGRNTSR